MFVFLYWICWVVVVNTYACVYGVVCVAVFSFVVLLALESKSKADSKTSSAGSATLGDTS